MLSCNYKHGKAQQSVAQHQRRQRHHRHCIWSTWNCHNHERSHESSRQSRLHDYTMRIYASKIQHPAGSSRIQQVAPRLYPERLPDLSALWIPGGEFWAEGGPEKSPDLGSGPEDHEKLQWPSWPRNRLNQIELAILETLEHYLIYFYIL